MEETITSNDRPVNGSLQWGHGDEAVEEFAVRVFDRQEPSRFNGATAMKPWKRPPFFEVLEAAGVLQWGHGDEAVEECHAKTGRAAKESLQWGHGDEAVEEAVLPRTADVDVPRFNGATAMKPWKRSGMSCFTVVSRCGFNGATAMKPWKRARPPDRLEQRT